MIKKNEYNKKLKLYLDKFKEFKSQIENKNKNKEFSEFYDNTYAENTFTSSYGEQIPLHANGFGNLMCQCIKYFDDQITFIQEIIELQSDNTNKYTKQMQTLLSDFIKKIEMEFQIGSQFNEGLIYEFRYKTNYAIEYNSIKLLSDFSDIEKNVVLVGGNGSGKSSFANALKGNDKKNICVIPAQKNLYFTMSDPSLLLTRNLDLQHILLDNNISKSKSKDDYEYFRFSNNQFTKLIIAMKEDYNGHLYRCDKLKVIPDDKKTIFGNLKNLMNVVFPEIELKFDSSKDYLNCIKNKNEYHVNAMSEGEKAALYYSISVFMAKENSFIVVDEPETYLNPSLATTLWDNLIKYKKDCQFIFITHSIDFVLGRNDAEIMWIKSYEYPNNWNLKKVEDNFKLPKKLLTEVLGSKKPILFCEGNDKTSLDYRVYQALFSSKYTIIPVGGHIDVKKYCDVLSKSEWSGIECKGIIDGDNVTECKKEKLIESNINVLPFNEIEMLLVCDEVINTLMNKIFPLEASKRINEFKEKFWELIKNQKEKIALNKVKNQAEIYIQNRGIENYSNIEEIKKSVENISEFDVKLIYNQSIERIEKIEQERDYKSLLEICNLKKEISKALANKHLDNDFEIKAIEHILTNKEIQNDLKEKYFKLLN